MDSAIRTCGYGPRVIRHLHACIDGRPVPVELWPSTILHEGQLVTLRAVPAGGGGGKGILRIVAMIAVLAAAVFFAPAMAAGLTAMLGTTVSAGVAGALITAVGGLIVNALIPPPVPKQSGLSRGATQSDPLVPSITGIRNQSNPFGVIPRIYGTHRVYPPYGGTPYTEISGDDQYLVLLFLVGYGPLTLSDLRIGTTTLGAFSDVSYVVRDGQAGDPPLSIYTRDVVEEAFNIQLTQAGGGVIRTTELNTTTISVDIALPRGLSQYANDGSRLARSVAVTVEYRVTDPPGSWNPAGTINLTRNTSSLVRGTLKWAVSEEQYDVRLTRTTEDSTDAQIFDDTYWTHLRSFRDDSPINQTDLPNMCTVEIRMKATDQLSGVVDSFNCLAQAKLSIFNGSSWTAPTATNSPAWAFAHELIGQQNHRAIGTTRLDGADLKAWADDCTTEGREYNAVHDSPGTVYERLRTIAAVGRASPSLRDGLYTVVRDIAQSTPLQIFSPRNSWDFKGSKAYSDIPHAFKVQFLNAVTDYQQDEIMVYDDGYDEMNATKFETLSLVGVTDADQAWKMGRYHLAVARLRPETFHLNTDMEHLPVTRGDLIRVNHDVLLTGLGAARVKEASSGAPTTVTVNPTAGTDDGYGTEFGETVQLTITTMVAGYVGAEGYTAGVRFPNVAVPKDQVLVSATLRLTHNSNSGLPVLRVYGDYLANAPTWSSSSPNRPLKADVTETTAYTEFTPSGGDDEVDVKAICEEILSHASWVSGNAMRFVLEDQSASEGVYVAYDTYEAAPASSELELVYTTGEIASIRPDEFFYMNGTDTYAVVFRFPNGVVTTHVLAVPTSPNENQTTLVFATPIPDTQEQPAVGDLFLFGISGSEALDCLIKEIRPFDGIHAELTLIPASPAVHDADTGTIPTYDSVITLPSQYIRTVPPVPVIVSIRSDESVLRRNVDGSLDIQIGIQIRLPSGTNRENLVYQVQYRESAQNGPWAQMPEQTAEVNEIFIFPVDQLTQYDIRVRTVKDRVQVSDWSITSVHVVQGKTNPPPDITSFSVERDSDGTRVFSWTLDEAPPDIAGYKIRWKLGTDGTWSNSTALHTGLLLASPYETNQLAAGQYTVLIKAVDTSDNESENAVAIISTLGDPRLAGALLQVNCKALGFPGTKTNAFVDDDGVLRAGGEFTWDDFDITTGLRASESISLGMTEVATIVPTSP